MEGEQADMAGMLGNAVLAVCIPRDGTGQRSFCIGTSLETMSACASPFDPAFVCVCQA